jgi:hypothetical protein
MISALTHDSCSPASRVGPRYAADNVCPPQQLSDRAMPGFKALNSHRRSTTATIGSLHRVMLCDRRPQPGAGPHRFKADSKDVDCTRSRYCDNHGRRQFVRCAVDPTKWRSARMKVECHAEPIMEENTS